MDTTAFDWKKYIEECFASTQYCSLATSGEEGVWSNPVFFAWDDHWNFYFVSLPTTRHMKNIGSNTEVAVSIYSTDQDTNRDVCGVQLEGSAEITQGEAREEASKVYFARAKGQESFYKDWDFVKITIKNLYYFDTRFFEENRVEVPPHIYHI